MDYINVLLTSVFSAVALFLITKLIGNRQVSQLSMFDYVNGITIGSIAAEMATSLEHNVFLPLIALVVYGLFTIAMSKISTKSLKLRGFIEGKPIILLDKGKLYKNHFKKQRVDLNEFLAECRTQGYFDIADIQTAVLEHNGKLSILPKADKRPLIPEDMNLSPSQDFIVANVIIDGQIIENNLRTTGNNHTWLKQQLSELGHSKTEDIFLATCTTDNVLTLYLSEWD